MALRRLDLTRSAIIIYAHPTKVRGDVISNTKATHLKNRTGEDDL